MDCTILVVKTKALISCTVTAQLIWAFVLAYAKSRFAHSSFGRFAFTLITTYGGGAHTYSLAVEWES